MNFSKIQYYIEFVSVKLFTDFSISDFKMCQLLGEEYINEVSLTILSGKDSDYVDLDQPLSYLSISNWLTKKNVKSVCPDVCQFSPVSIIFPNEIRNYPTRLQAMEYVQIFLTDYYAGSSLPYKYVYNELLSNRVVITLPKYFQRCNDIKMPNIKDIIAIKLFSEFKIECLSICYEIADKYFNELMWSPIDDILSTSKTLTFLKKHYPGYKIPYHFKYIRVEYNGQENIFEKHKHALDYYNSLMNDNNNNIKRIKTIISQLENGYHWCFEESSY